MGAVLCDSHAECPGGHICDEGVCSEIDALVCEPGSGRCEGNVVVVCNALGTALTRVDCGAEVCTAGETGASCLSANCMDGEVGCVDGVTRFACSGGERTLSACEDGEGCQSGACVERICAPGTRRCVDESTGAVCGASGTAETLVQCSLVEGCEDAAGCACVGGACTPRVCAPGARVCEDGAVVECDAAGAGYEPAETCGSEQECVAGACVESGCGEGDVRCAGDRLLRCVGGSFTETDCAAAGQFCDESASACVARVCQPSVARCDETATVRLVCDARGASEERRPCGDGEYCSAGTCAPQECVPGERRCSGGNAYTCPVSGGGFVLTQRCGADETCEEGVCRGGEAECVNPFNCTSPPDRCEGDVLVTHGDFGQCISGRCDYSEGQTRSDCARSGLVCSRSELRCVPPRGASCTSDAGCAEGERCASGRCVECITNAGCDGGARCVDNACVECSCMPGFLCDAAGECVEGDPTSCVSDSECRALAERLGVSPDRATCDPEIGCYMRGSCSDGLGGDAFNAMCPSGLECTLQIDLNNPDAVNVCVRCDPEDAHSCRAGETCTVPLFGIPTSYPYYAVIGSGGGFPTP